MNYKNHLPCIFICVFLSLFIVHQVGMASKDWLNESISSESYPSQQTGTDSMAIDEDDVRRLIAAGEQIWITDKDQADSLVRIAFGLIDNTRVHDSLLARVYHLFGKVLIDKKENNAGIDTLLQCIVIKKRAFGLNSPELAKSYNYIGIGYFQLHDYENAGKYYNQSAQLLKENNVYNQNLYDAYLNMGIVNAVLGKYNVAYEYFYSTFLILDSLESTIDSLLIARFYHNYGALATLNGKLKEANNFFDIAESIYLKKYGSNYRSIAGINTNKGTNAFYNYDFSQAMLYYQRSLEINLYNEQVKLGIPMAYANLSSVSIKTKDFKQSVDYCLEGLTYEPNSDLKLLLFSNLGKSYAMLGNDAEADHNYNEALTLVKNEKVYPTRSISLYQSYADYLFENHAYAKSKIYYDAASGQALTYYGEQSAVYATILSRLGDYFVSYEKAYDSALYYYDQSIEIWNNILQIDNDIIHNENFNEIGFVDAYRGRAQTLFSLFKQGADLNYLRKSLENYQILLDRVDKISKNLDRENSFLLIEKIDPVYDQAIGIAYEIFSQTQDNAFLETAFELSERSKSTVLLNSVQNIQALKTAEVPMAVVNYEKQLQDEINGLRKLLADEQDKAQQSEQKISFFNARLLVLLVKHDSLVEDIEQNHPKYYALKYDRSVITLKQLLETLAEDEGIIEYVLANSCVYIMAISKDNISFKRIFINQDFNSSLQYLIGLKTSDLSKHRQENTLEFIRHSGNLWKFLIKPVYDGLKNKKLIIIPDGLLGYLPFDILLNTDVETDVQTFRELPYLLKEFPVSYSYSSSLRFNPYFNDHKTASGNLVAFAPTYSGSQQDDDQNFRNSFANIPNAEMEALNAKQIFGGRVFLDKEATRENFLSNSSGYKIIHLAMHALINDSLPMFSELVFTNSNDESTSNLLHTYEIYGLNLDAELVTLSACNTGTGKLQQGEGILSLARGFVYAGVPSVVMTLWEVQDESGSEIMNSYYTYLSEGDQKAVALQKAKLDFLTSANMLKSHPYYWSSYIVSGDTSSLSSNNGSKFMMIFGFALITIFIALITMLKKRKARGSVKDPHASRFI